MTRLTIKAAYFPLFQAALTGTSTAIAVLLVTLWRPNRSRHLPFYSDATHNDPERIILACGENLACMLMPIVAIVEYLHQSRLLAGAPKHARLSCFPCRLVSTRVFVKANFVVTLLTSIFFFITANVPSIYPSTRIHQFAASSLILFYALQATFKAVLASAFSNYRVRAADVEHASHADEEGLLPKAVSAAGPSSIWDRHHMIVRVGLAVALWGVLLGTWVCFMGIMVARTWGTEYAAWPKYMTYGMAIMVYVATGSCVMLMVVMGVDMRGQSFVVTTHAHPR